MGEDYVSDLRRKMHDIHEQVRSNIRGASDRMKGVYDARVEGRTYNEGDLVWLYNPQRRRGLSPKLQQNWEGPFEIVKRINDVVYRIRKVPNGKPRVVHFNRLAPYAGDNDAEEGVRIAEVVDEYDHFMSVYSGSSKARFGVTREEQRDLFQVPSGYSLVHCIAEDLEAPAGTARVFQKKFGRLRELRNRAPRLGTTLALKDGNRYLYHLVTRRQYSETSNYRAMWDALQDLRRQVLSRGVKKLAMPKLECGMGGLDWRTVRNMVEHIFKGLDLDVLVCSYHPQTDDTTGGRTIPCYFFRNGRCREGDGCRYLHESESMFRDETFLRRGQCNENEHRAPSVSRRQKQWQLGSKVSATVQKIREASRSTWSLPVASGRF